LTERHVRWILVAVLVLQLILLGAQAPQSDGPPSRVQAVSLWLVSPIAHTVDAAVSAVKRLGVGFTVRSSLLEENKRLRSELAELKNERIRWFDASGQLERLQGAVSYTQAGGSGLLAADVVYIDHASWLRSLLLYIGDQSVEVNQAVVAPGGVVGRVVAVAGHYAKVQLVTDRSATVGAMIRRTRRQGLSRGAEEGLLSLDFVPVRSDIRIGDEVVTAGIDGIFPRGIPIGRVMSIKAGEELFSLIEMVPTVDFGRLDQAFIVEREAVPTELMEIKPNERP
jgi:rod shape-determining protein MreC